MDQADPGAPPRRHRTSIDRAGFALATGGGLCGLAALLLAVASGERDIAQLLWLAILGALFGTALIAVLGLPAWAVLHRLHRRRAWHAATLGAALTLILAIAAQTDGFTTPLLFRWLSAIATGLLAAAIAAGIALAMWRVAYRVYR